jgi:DNA polymerase
MEQDFYGGLADENVTQAAARDCMANGMHNTEAAGYPCILTVHDEDIAERKKGEGNLDEFVRLLTKPADWMKGLPLAAEGYVSTRYKK